MGSPQESPLLIKVHTEFKAIGFGEIAIVPEIARLQRDLNHILARTVKTLPPSLAASAGSLLDNYSGRCGEFYSLFYIPIWSFLHWTLVNQPSVSAEVRILARTPHAMSLFLHLWDDHLCDGQLDVDVTRLQLRTIAWQSYISSCYELCEMVGLGHQLVDEHVSQYLSAQQIANTVGDLDGYCRLFSQQIKIWTVIPRILDYALSVAQNGHAIQRVIELFAICWRLIDDIQDVDLDLMTGKQNAVWIQLDKQGQALWSQCRMRSLEKGTLDRGTWKELVRAIRDGGCLSELLSRTSEMLTTGEQIAASNGWAGLARELEQSRKGISRELALLG